MYLVHFDRHSLPPAVSSLYNRSLIFFPVPHPHFPLLFSGIPAPPWWDVGLVEEAYAFDRVYVKLWVSLAFSLSISTTFYHRCPIVILPPTPTPWCNRPFSRTYVLAPKRIWVNSRYRQTSFTFPNLISIRSACQSFGRGQIAISRGVIQSMKL